MKSRVSTAQAERRAAAPSGKQRKNTKKPHPEVQSAVFCRQPGNFSTGPGHARRALQPILSLSTSRAGNPPRVVNGGQDRAALFYLERLLPDPEVEEEPPLLPLLLPEPAPAPGVTGLLVLLEPPPLLSLELSLSLSLELSLLLLELLLSLAPLLPELPWLLPVLAVPPVEPEVPPEAGEADEDEPEEPSVALLPCVAPLLEESLLLPEAPCCWPWPPWPRWLWRWLRHWPNSSENLL